MRKKRDLRMVILFLQPGKIVNSHPHACNEHNGSNQDEQPTRKAIQGNFHRQKPKPEEQYARADQRVYSAAQHEDKPPGFRRRLISVHFTSLASSANPTISSLTRC